MESDGHGPDFQEASIRIGSTLWVGDVEVHLRSSDWYKHQHAGDARYQRLILHVVYEQDLADADWLLQRFPCVELKGRVSRSMIGQYEVWMQQLQPIACAGVSDGPADVPQLIWTNWKERLLAERWEQEKGKRIHAWLQRTQGDWEEVAYISLARGFGMNRNAAMFEALATRTPHRLLARNRHIPDAAAALLLARQAYCRGGFRMIIRVIFNGSMQACSINTGFNRLMRPAGSGCGCARLISLPSGWHNWPA